jgi:hypothetical protein
MVSVERGGVRRGIGLAARDGAARAEVHARRPVGERDDRRRSLGIAAFHEHAPHAAQGRDPELLRRRVQQLTAQRARVGRRGNLTGALAGSAATLLVGRVQHVDAGDDEGRGGGGDEEPLHREKP